MVCLHTYSIAYELVGVFRGLRNMQVTQSGCLHWLGSVVFTVFMQSAMFIPLPADVALAVAFPLRTEVKKKKKTKKVDKKDDNGLLTMNEWLDESSKNPPVSVGKAVDTLKAEKKKKKKKHLTPSRDAYEEPSGVCTPSNPNVDLSPKYSAVVAGPMRLGANSDLVVDYETSSVTKKSENLTVTLSLKNVGEKLVKNVEVNCIDTLCTKLKREGDNGVGLKDELSPSSAEQIRGSIVYFTKDDEGSSDGKLDFRLSLRPTTFISPTPISKEGYSQLLNSEDVDFSASAQFQSDLPFKELILRSTKLGHFSVVEEAAAAVCLHGMFVSGEPISSS